MQSVEICVGETVTAYLVSFIFYSYAFLLNSSPSKIGQQNPKRTHSLLTLLRKRNFTFLWAKNPYLFKSLCRLRVLPFFSNSNTNWFIFGSLVATNVKLVKQNVLSA